MKGVSKMEKYTEDSNTEVTESRKSLGNDAVELSDAPPSKMMKQFLPNLSSQSLPETNAQHKCLDLGLSCSGLHSWLFTLPELKLKKLGIRTQDVSLVPNEIVIQVEHVTFNSSAENLPNQLFCSLEEISRL